jgi:hypothetical protein
MSNITTYLVSASLILLVIRQIREHPLDARSLVTPVLAVGAAAVMFLHSIPTGGSDLALEAAGVAASCFDDGTAGRGVALARNRPPGESAPRTSSRRPVGRSAAGCRCASGRAGRPAASEKPDDLRFSGLLVAEE